MKNWLKVRFKTGLLQSVHGMVRFHLVSLEPEFALYASPVNFDPDALTLAIKFAGSDHILAGSDYPHLIGSIPKMKDSMGALRISDGERSRIFGGNALALLGIA